MTGVLGLVVTLTVLEGRAWDPGPENLWMHADSEAAIDWAGVTGPTLRVLPDDPAGVGAATRRDGAGDLGGASLPALTGTAVRRVGPTERRRAGAICDVADGRATGNDHWTALES